MDLRDTGADLSLPFAAAPLVDFLRGQLWRSKPGRTAGRASLLIGSGFSRNADPSVAEARPFPTWPELTERLARSLDPFGNYRVDPMRVAQEYEAMFGRARLDDALRSLIPDDDHRPSELHRRLLALPWADVFTTNWDTLLERASPEAHEHAYDIVMTPSQIPSAALPRIVKLHGTLPANGPFIVTEEDFRTYPRLFAPFVNMVQQSMMETSMVLLGFSGDDPNFLHWSGWVRDNLGHHAPPTYLIGWLTLTPQRRRMLEDRKVVPIDLSELPDARSWPEELRHRYAIEWFLHALEAGRPPRLLTWPLRDAEVGASARHLGWSMPDRDDGRSSHAPPSVSLAADDAALTAEFQSVVAAWRSERESYPKWWIAPHAVRTRLWACSSHSLADAGRRIGLLPMPERLRAMAESLRRLELCQLDAVVIHGLPELLERILATVSPDGRKWSIEGAEGLLDLAAREDWRQCLLASARLARSVGDAELHESRLSVLEAAFTSRPDTRDEATFERATWHAQFLQDAALDAALDAWNTTGSDPACSIQKAGLLAGAGRYAEAETTLIAGMARTRRDRRGDLLNLPALSREGWGLVLGLAWQHRDLSTVPHEAVRAGERDPWGRWEYLRQYGCDGWSDIRDLMAEMREPPPPPSSERVRGFEPGTSSETRHFTSGLPAPYQAGRQMLRLAEATALPAAANHTSLLKQALERAIEACGRSNPPLPIVLLLARVSDGGDDKALHRYLTRARVATLTDQEVTLLVGALQLRIATARTRAKPEWINGFWTSRLRAATEILSRLMTRCSDQQARDAFTVACSLVEDGWSPADAFAGEEIHKLFRRAVTRLPAEDLVPAFIRVAALPWPSERRARPGRGARDPITVFQRRHSEMKNTVDCDAIRLDPALIEKLVSAGRLSPLIRGCAIERLHATDQLGLLAAEDRKRLGEVVWGTEESSEGGLPADLDYHPWAFLLMAEQREGQAAAAFRREFLSGRNQRATGDALWNLGVGLDQTYLAARPFLLSGEDFSQVAALALRWAKAAPSLGQDDPFGRDDEEAAQDGLGRVLVAARMPDDVLLAVRLKVTALQSGPARRLSGLLLVAGMVLSAPDLAPLAAGWFRRGLVCADARIVREALTGLNRWVDAAQRNPGSEEPPDDLVEEVAGILTARRPGTVGSALSFATWLFQHGPARLYSRIATRCDLALSYLADETSYANEVVAGYEAELDTPLVRQHAVALAGAMRQVGCGEGEGVIRWISEAASDPLFEVRRAADGQTH